MGSTEVFSFHLLQLRFLDLPGFLFSPLQAPGLLHSENFATMKLGEPVLSTVRYDLRKVAVFALWQDQAALDDFLSQSSNKAFADGWHVRLRLYRRWGRVSEIADAVIDPALATPGRPVVAVTVARLKLMETLRFTRFGKPVESQVRDHPGNKLALAAFRPFNSFCTFSIWKNEAEMIGMVRGKNPTHDGESHKVAMQERVRKDFHSEFTTMRFVPIKEVGTWDGRSSYTSDEEP